MSHEPLPVFVSYASYDNKSDNVEERWLDRLMQFMKPLELEGKISSWADTELSAGSNWRREIKLSIEKAKVAILLVSPAFLASEFIRSEELPRLLRNSDPDIDPNDISDMAEGMLILPILLRPCLISHTKFEILDGPSELRYSCLGDFQYVPKSSAMNGLSQYEQDKQFEEIALRIIDALEIDKFSPPSKPPSKQEEDKLAKLLTKFLEKYNRWWFNALRINKWGSQQSGFKEIGEYSLKEIRQGLESLSNKNNILSKDGNKSRVYKSR
ncbi:MAG: toll/interleukin-1 receptor domain-containing protein [Bacteroidetes bacterium]|nr:toll/interleukin-1 receptor domain-containing protein [Bacteroidota bacterium]